MRLKVSKIIEHSSSIKTFCLDPLDSYQKYFAGQYLTVHTGKDGDVLRPYSLSSSPTNPGTYEISVKLIEGGSGSTWMHTQVKEGDELICDEPEGKFTLQQAALTSVFVAAGIGVTPVLSMVKYALGINDTRKLFFFYASRHEEDLVFHQELLALASEHPNLIYVPIISGDVGSAWEGERGRVTKELLEKTGVIFKRAEIYTCGPDEMMKDLEDMFLANKGSKSNFHKELFMIAAPVNSGFSGKLTVNYKGVDYEYNKEQSLLDFLHSKKVRVRHSCKSGICGSCEVQLKEGEVRHLNEDFFSEEDLAEGRRLACASFPITDVVVDKHN
ncbi:iron-sulfur cluster-binding domain-containing protein [Lentisphaera profundi]|uniref:Iron-sulfur cluster-binding domain-containing protein n=1 Tax=Lentisphaera profundi TaxID=1658616 RepID=A0ABY7VUE1_9BACT|nr:iron-sulfur cluster-binding domain-containing protein [Lentisphaera profundi]WDE97836.1 iron-sulfur cluster-binding domain-containing protein [Lentisphaera profundi]